MSGAVFLTAEALQGLSAIRDETFQCVITSPPYWGLRDYQTARWFGGDPKCRHKERDRPQQSGLAHAGAWSPAGNRRSVERRHSEQPVQFKRECRRCGARRVDDQLGLERTPSEYIDRLVAIFREVRRVLRPDGVVWLNLGDSWIGDGTGSGDCSGGGERGERWKGRRGFFGDGPKDRVESVVGPDVQPNRMAQELMKPKDLVMMPARVAIALQEDGWWIRQEVIWSKPNPMPESITDRPTRSHETIFLLSKSGRPVYWTHRDLNGTRSRPEPDFRYIQAGTGAESIEEPRDWQEARVACPACGGNGRLRKVIFTPLFGDLEADSEHECAECRPEDHTVAEWRRINLWTGHDYFYDADAIREPHQMRPQARPRGHKQRPAQAGMPTHTFKGLVRPGPGADGNPAGRNARTVWEIATRPFKGAHFATFPEELARRCMRAGSSQAGACATCGAPWARVTERKFVPQADVSPDRGIRGHDQQKPMDSSSRWSGTARGATEVVTKAWRPTCNCGGGAVPCRVADPFSGSGTVVAVAVEEGRSGVGIDLSLRYNVIGRDRALQSQPPISFHSDEARK